MRPRVTFVAIPSKKNKEVCRCELCGHFVADLPATKLIHEMGHVNDYIRKLENENLDLRIAAAKTKPKEEVRRMQTIRMGLAS